MTNRNSTKRALLSSVMALVLCFSMLLGTTFAWFTDSVTSAGNIIKSGDLEVGMYWADGTKDVPALDTANNEGWTNAESGAMFTADQIWEPGYVDVKHIMIKNEGSLALKYALSIVANGTVSILSDVIDVYFVDPAVKVEGRTALTENNKLGTLTQVLAGLENGTFGTGTLLAGKAVAVTLALKMQESANNDYENKSIGTDFSLKLVATQMTYEGDSFDDQYDADATTYEPWDGTVDTAWYDASETEFVLESAEQLAGLADLVNSGTTFAGKIVKLGTDVDLKGLAWTPIGDCTSAKYFHGTFDGQGSVIANLTVNNTSDSEFAASGLFGWVEAKSAIIKNVTVSGASVSGHHWVGAIAGYMTGTIANCKVIDSTVLGTHANDDADGDKVGGIVGCLNSDSYLKSNTVIGSTVIGNRDVGGIAGSVAASTLEMSDNKVVDTVISYETEKTYASAGLIVSGRTGYVANETNTAVNSVVKKATVASDTATLAAAVSAGETTVYLQEGNYELKGNQADGLTIVGVGDGVKVSNLTNFAGNGNLGAIWQNVNFENVIFTEKVYTMADGAKSTFTNCTFEQGFRGGYSSGVTFTGCTFYDNSQGFALHFEKVYTTLTVTDCTFVEGTIAFGDNGNGLATFTNCTFSGESTRTEYFDAWASCVLNDCTFAEGTEIWHEHWENGETVTLNNTTGAVVVQK